MKTYLLPQDGRFYKANLHCHSTVSDGKKTPEDLKALYQAEGYSVLAYTDHHVQVSHDELTDEGFLALIGYEISLNENAVCPRQGRVCHICLISGESSHTLQEIYYSNQYEERNKERLHYDTKRPPMDRTYSCENVRAVMRLAREQGYFVTYNHPTWSGEAYPQYMNYDGMHAMEIVNFSSFTDGQFEINEREYDDMISGGKRIFCIATDDNHNVYPRESQRWDSFGGFTMVKADRLEHSSIVNALKNGHFYASQGPEIYDLWMEDGEVHLVCTAANLIRMKCQYRTQALWAGSDGPLTEATFRVDPKDVYFRITVVDSKGKSAFTNAYFLN